MMYSRSTCQDEVPKMTRNKKHSKQEVTLSRPVTQARLSQTTSTAQTQFKKDRILVKHTESIGLVKQSDDFAVVRSFSVNPGLSATFPWLSLQAQGWEAYRFRRLSFSFKTIVGTDTDGIMIITPEYDVTDDDPGDIEEALCALGSVRGPLWSADVRDSLTLHLNPQALNKQGPERLIRIASNPSDTDLHLYDAAVVHFCSYGGADATTYVGEVQVSYEVELITPQIPRDELGKSVCGRWGSVNGSLAAPFGDVPLKVGNLNAGATGDHLLLNEKGHFLGTLEFGGGTVTDAPALTGTYGATVREFTPNVNAGATKVTQTFEVIADSVGSLLTVVATGVAASFTYFDMILTKFHDTIGTTGTLGDFGDVAD